MAETYDRDQWGVIQALDALGTTDDAIAASLKALGIGGERCMSAACPIANYIRSVFGQVDVEVDPGLITVYDLDEHVSVWPEKPLVDFIEHFDAQVYPDLIKEPA